MDPQRQTSQQQHVGIVVPNLTARSLQTLQDETKHARQPVLTRECRARLKVATDVYGRSVSKGGIYDPEDVTPIDSDTSGSVFPFSHH
jgi:hypothetical protein